MMIIIYFILITRLLTGKVVKLYLWNIRVLSEPFFVLHVLLVNLVKIIFTRIKYYLKLRTATERFIYFCHSYHLDITSCTGQFLFYVYIYMYVK